MRNLMALLLAGTMIAAPLHAEPGLPPEDQVNAALDSHPSVQASQARIDAAKAEARALAKGPHEVTANLIYSNRSIDNGGDVNEYDAQLTRAVRLPGKARLDREIGKFGIAAAQNHSEDIRHQAALLLNQGWWDWLGAGEEARVDAQAVGNYERLLEAVRRRVALRDAAQLEADQAEAMLGTARLTAQQSAARAALARKKLEVQFPGLTLAETPPEVPLPSLPEAGVDELGRLVIERSHEIRAADAEAGRAGATASRLDADRIADPTVGLRLFSERGGTERGAGLVFSMPLGGGHRQALADQAEAEASAARAELMAARFGAQEMAETDMLDARAMFASWQRAREAVAAQVAALEKLRLGQKAGEIDLADELYGERQVHDAFRAEAAARTEAMRAITRLRIDSHTIWADEATEPK